MSKYCNCQTKGSVEYNQILLMEKFLLAVHDKTRLRMICLIKDDFMTVGEIQRSLNIPQNMTSHHLAKLKKLDLLIEKRDGQFRRYTLNQKKFNDCLGIFKCIAHPGDCGMK